MTILETQSIEIIIIYNVYILTLNKLGRYKLKKE